MSGSKTSNQNLKDFFVMLVKSFVIGAAMLVPGVSGGTAAIIMNIYDDLILAVSNIFSEFKKSMRILVPLAIGLVIGFFLCSNVISGLYERYPMFMGFLFMGIVAGSIPFLIKKAGVKKFTYHSILYPVIGILIVLGINLIPRDLLTVEGISPVLFYAILIAFGLFSSIALVLPGISFSHMLVVLGIYVMFTDAIKNIDILFIAVFGISLLIGILLTTKFLGKLMTNHPMASYLVIIGFVIGSFTVFVEQLPVGFGQIALCALLFAVGFCVMFAISKTENIKEMLKAKKNA